MIILLPYRKDLLNGLGLKYALRSIETYLTGYEDVLIVGRPPDWYKGRWIYKDDVSGRKQYSIYTKIIAGIQLGNIKGNFLFWNDDHFLNNYLSITHFKFWHDGYLDVKIAKSGRYFEAISNTLSEYESALNYDIHVPIIYNSDRFLGLFREREDEVCIKSFYCASFLTEGEYMEDCKIDELLTEDQINERISGRLFFSTGSNGIKQPMINKLQEFYPNKSKWEK